MKKQHEKMLKKFLPSTIVKQLTFEGQVNSNLMFTVGGAIHFRNKRRWKEIYTVEPKEDGSEILIVVVHGVGRLGEFCYKKRIPADRFKVSVEA